MVEAEELAAEIERAGGKAAPVQADLGDPAQVEGLVAAAHAAVGPVTVLVNNAAIFERDRATDFTLEQWDRQLAINLRAPVVLAREFARRLPAGASGLVVNLLDERIATPRRSYFSYTMSKLALAAATELLAAALAPRVRVNGIAPGLSLISGDQNEDDFRRLVDRTPLGKGSSPGCHCEGARLPAAGGRGHRTDPVRGRRPPAGGAGIRRPGRGPQTRVMRVRLR